MIFFSTTTFAQFICDVEQNRNWFYQVEFDDDEEFSGLAYHPQLKILFMPLDQPICATDPNIGNKAICTEKRTDCTEDAQNENCNETSIYMKAFNLKEKTAFNVLFSKATEDLLTDCDFEGITHLKEDYFALLEEDENKIYFLQYKPNEQQFEVLSGHKTGIAPIEGLLANDPCFTYGLAGITYNPNTGRIYVVEEEKRESHRGPLLYSVPIVLPGEQLPDGSISNGIVNESFLNSSVSLGYIKNMPRTTGLSHLGKIYPVNHPLANHILVSFFATSSFPVTRKIVEFKISLDSNNDLAESLLPKIELDFNKVKTINGEVEPKPEGIVVAENTIYAVSEWYGLSSYNISSCTLVDCEPNVLLEAIDTDPLAVVKLSYESSELIETKVTNSRLPDVVVKEKEVIDLRSNHITLNPGFKVEASSACLAEIEPCTK